MVKPKSQDAHKCNGDCKKHAMKDNVKETENLSDCTLHNNGKSHDTSTVKIIHHKPKSKISNRGFWYLIIALVWGSFLILESSAELPWVFRVVTIPPLLSRFPFAQTTTKKDPGFPLIGPSL